MKIKIKILLWTHGGVFLINEPQNKTHFVLVVDFLLIGMFQLLSLCQNQSFVLSARLQLSILNIFFFTLQSSWTEPS